MDKITVSSNYKSFRKISIANPYSFTIFSFMMLFTSSMLLMDFPNSYAQSANTNDTTENIQTEQITNNSNITGNISELVDFGSNINQIQGHLNASLMNKQTGNESLAVAHAGHPIDEVYSLISQQIANANGTLNQTLSASLIQLSELAGNSTTEQYNDELFQRMNLISQTYQQVIPEDVRNNLTYGLFVISDLITIAGHEYEEAVSNNTITEMMEYQDGQAFIQQAKSLLETYHATTGDNTTVKAQQDLEPLFMELDQQIQNIDNPDDVTTSIDQIVQRISTMTGEVEGETVDDTDNPLQMISNIRTLLNQTVGEYNDQNYSEAEALATEAYLDNYEYVEMPLAEKDRTLMETTEIMLREELRKLIIDRAPIETIESQIQNINDSLDQAEELLTAP